MPDHTRACLFDLDGVLTQTATVHAAAWKAMFDAYLRERAARADEPFAPFDAVRRLRTVRRRQAARSTACGRSWPRAASTCRRVTRPTRPRPRRSAAWARARTRSCCGSSASGASRPTRGRCASCGRPRRRAAHARSSRRAPTAGRCLPPPGSKTCFEERVDGHRRRARSTCRASPRPTPFSPRRAALGVDAGAGRPSSRTPWPVSRRAAPAPSAGSSASTGSGQADALASPRRRHRRAGPRRPAGRPRDPAPGVRGRALGASARPPRTSTRSPRANRSSRSPTATSASAATSTRASPMGCPGTYLNGFYESRPLPYAGGRLRLSRRRARRLVNVTDGKIIRLLVDDEPFDVRYGDAARATSACSTCAPACCAATVEWVSPAGRGGADHLDAAGLVHAAGGGGHPATRSSRSTSAARVVVQSELVANEPLPRPGDADPRAPRRSRSAAAARTTVADRGARVVLVHTTATQRAAHGRRDGPRRRRPRRASRAADGELRGPRPRDRDRRPRRRASACGWSKLLAYGWSRQRSVPACETRWRRRSPRPATPDGTASWPRSSAYLDDFWARADVEVDGDAEVQQAIRFALFHALQAGARAERRAIPAKGLTGPGYDGHAFWDIGDLRPAGAHVHAAGGRRATPCAGATRHARARARAGRGRSGSPARHFRGARSRARSARATGPRAPRPSTSTPTSPTRSSATRPPPATRPSSARSASSCSSRRPGCGARSATTTGRGASASTASPAPTSTARSPTTTSTRT